MHTWEMAVGAVEKLGGKRHFTEIRDFVRAQYDCKTSDITIDRSLRNASVNAQSRVAWSTNQIPRIADPSHPRDKLYWYAGNYYEIYQPKYHGKWGIKKTDGDILIVYRVSEPTLQKLTAEEFAEEESEAQRSIKNLSKEELRKKAYEKDKKPARVLVETQGFRRNQAVIKLVKIRANGKCELCRADAPFYRENNEPFLEAHHIAWLSRGGDDTVENAAALCPNCHRRMHILDLEADKVALKNSTASAVAE